MKRKPTALKFTDAEIDGTSLKEHSKSEKPKEPQAPDPSKRAHRRKKRAAVNHSKQAKSRNASRFCIRSPALGKEDSLGCSADKARRAYLRFEEERVKKPSKLNHAVKKLPNETAISMLRSNIQSESEDNSEVQAVDTALGAVQTINQLSMILSGLRSSRITGVRNIRAAVQVIQYGMGIHIQVPNQDKKPLSRKTTQRKPRTMQIMQSPLLKKPQRLLLR